MKAWFSILLAGALGAAASFTAFSVIRDWERGKLQVRFQLLAAERSQAIRSEFLRHADLVDSVSALYAASNRVERNQFHQFSVRLRNQHQDLVSLEWLPRVSASEQPAFEERLRAEGLDGFSVWAEPEGEGGQRINREESFPIEYAYNFTFQPSAFGLDRFASAKYRKTMEQARDEDYKIAVPVIHSWVDQGMPQEAEVLEVFMPIYRNGVMHETVEDRRQNLIGFVMGSFEIGKTAEEALQRLKAEGVEILLEDITEPTQKRICWSHPFRPRASARRAHRMGDLMEWEGTWTEMGRVWRVRCFPGPAFLWGYGLRDSWMVLVLCLLVTILALEHIVQVYRRASKVERLVQERTRDLSCANTELERDRRRIAAQYVVTKMLAESESLHEAAPKILKRICETLGWEAGAIWGLDRAANALRCEEFWSAPLRGIDRFEEETRRAAFPRGLGLPGRVWASQKPAWIPDVTKDDNFPRADAAQEAGLHAAFAFPVRLQEEVLGVVEFFNDEIQQPDEQLLKMMDSVGSQIGQFIERKRLEKLKDEFISTVSHEMRTPLSITKEGISLVLDRIPGEINPEQEGILATARGNIDRLARIINDLLDISKLEAGRVHLRREKLELADLFRQVAGAFQPRAAAQGLLLQVQTPEQGASVYADADKVTEILTNLVDNAMKFTPSGSIRLGGKAGGEWVECMVEDTGTGITAEDLPRVFGKFEQFGRLSGAGARGTGLGLAIVKHLVELHQGAIRVESQPGKGTRFLFTLPSYSPRNVLQGLIGDKVREAAVKGTKLSLLWLTASPAEPSDLTELEHLIERKACRREDQVIRMPQGLALLAADCDREAALKVQSRCERLLRAALVRKGLSERIQIRCDIVVFPDEVRTTEELFSKVERWHRQTDEEIRMAG